MKQKIINNTVKLDGIDFNADWAGTQEESAFVDHFKDADIIKHTWKNKTPDQVLEGLRKVHQQSVAAIAKASAAPAETATEASTTTQTSGNDDSGRTSEETGGAQSGGDTGGSGTGESTANTGSESGAAAQGTRSGRSTSRS